MTSVKSSRVEEKIDYWRTKIESYGYWRTKIESYGYWRTKIESYMDEGGVSIFLEFT